MDNAIIEKAFLIEPAREMRVVRGNAEDLSGCALQDGGVVGKLFGLPERIQRISVDNW